jgi:hypothetical protein
MPVSQAVTTSAITASTKRSSMAGIVPNLMNPMNPMHPMHPMHPMNLMNPVHLLLYVCNVVIHPLSTGRSASETR